MRPRTLIGLTLLTLSACACLRPDPPTIEYAEMVIYLDGEGCPAMHQEVWGRFDGDWWSVLVDATLCQDIVVITHDWPGEDAQTVEAEGGIVLAPELAWLWDLFELEF